MTTDVKKPKINAPKKLIEVALPLDAINEASAREKSIRHGHPSTLHLWWARRPLAAARAVLFAQLVNDPGGERGWGKYKGQTKEDAAKERQRLFRLIEQLVQWENTNNEALLEQAREEIRKSWRETCELNKGVPGFDPEKLPPFHDPFAGGGTIPLEAQRLGLEAHASDLNPVAVLINKAMIEIPPKFAGRPPVGPIPKGEKQSKAKATEDWSGTRGLAEDVRRYGAWMREEAFKKIGHLYPPVKITADMAKGRPDLKAYVGQERTVIAWLWCRTVASPNPAMGGAHVPLISSYWLSSKKGKEAYLEPVVEGNTWRLVVRRGKPKNTKRLDIGTKSGRGQFTCLLSGTAISSEYIRDEGINDRLSARMTAVVVDVSRERVFLEPSPEHHQVSNTSVTESTGTKLPDKALGFRVQRYGILNHDDLFTLRQRKLLFTFAALIEPARVKIASDSTVDYADAVATYLAIGISKIADYNSSQCSWSTSRSQARSVFTRQALPMIWDYVEVNPFAGAAGDVSISLRGISKVLEGLPATQRHGAARQQDARDGSPFPACIISTDPPYFDNIGYANLADFFYIWMRRSMRKIWPDILATILTPKAPELIASVESHGSKEKSEKYFLTGMTEVMRGFADRITPAFPTTIYYAFKQSEADAEGEASTGWETFVGAVLGAGLSISGTWPMRSERTGRTRDIDSNALASSIVLVCRPRPDDAPSISRRQFLRELRSDLPLALELMISGAEGQSPVAPVDLQQAAIGPGMAIFSKYKEVLEADGSPMPVRQALIHINRAIDDYFSHAEADLDTDTRFCLTWFEQNGFEKGKFGDADVLARAKGTSVEGVVEAGAIEAGRGEVRLLRVNEYRADWDPRKDKRVPIWEALHQLCRALNDSEAQAGKLLAAMPHMQEPVRQLAYRLHIFCERKGWAEDALRYNTLMTSWSAIVEHSERVGHVGEQLTLG